MRSLQKIQLPAQVAIGAFGAHGVPARNHVATAPLQDPGTATPQ